MIQSRRCAKCAKAGGVPMSLLRKWAGEAKLKLKAPESDYFHVVCAKAIHARLVELGRAKPVL